MSLEPCFPVSVNIISVFVWVVGVLGNALNLIVFAQKEMNRSPVNLIFWWLSLSDLFELLTIALYEYSCAWCFQLDSSCIFLNYEPYMNRNLFSILLSRGSNILLLTFHITTVLLNIALAVFRFMVVRNPIKNRSFSSRRSIQRMVIGLNIISLVLSLPILYRAIFNTTGMDLIKMRNFWLLSFDIFVRLGSLAVLVICGTMFIFAVIRAREDRERTLDSDQTRETGRTMSQINTLTIIIILMFIISDLIIAVDGGAMLNYYILIMNRDSIADEKQLARYLNAFTKFKIQVMCYQVIALLVNCSYSVFCYLMFSSQYRKTLRLYLKNKCTCVFRKLKRKNPEHITEVHTLSTQVENSIPSL